MTTFDRVVLIIIAIGLLLNAWGPFIVQANRAQDVNISHVGGKALSFGEGIPTK